MRSCTAPARMSNFTENPMAKNMDAYWMPFTANRQFKKAPRLLAKRQGHVLLDARGPPDPRRHGRAVVRQRRPRAAEDRAGDRRSRRPSWTSRRRSRWRHPKAFELAEQAGQARAAGHEQGVLHQLGLRVGRHRAEDGHRLPPRARRRCAHAADRPRARLPRRQLRRHLGRRHRRQPQDVRHAAGRRRSHPPHARPGAQRLLASASPSTAPNSPTTSSAWSRCTMRRRSPR